MTRKSSSSGWARLGYTVFFALAYGLAEVVLGAIVIAQLVFVGFTGAPNAGLRQLGDQLSRYVYGILRYLTCATDELPFPFGGQSLPVAQLHDSRPSR